MQALLLKLKILFTELFNMQNTQTPQGLKILAVAKSWLGKDASPEGLADNTVACAESVTHILMGIGYIGYTITGTYTLLRALQQAPEWVEVSNPLPGDIIISPSGMGGKNGITSGHVGIYAENDQIMSNNSNTGLWDLHLNLASWTARYKVLGGYPILYFRRIL